ncbi:kinase-like protein [Trametes sanguinea]|nr:kinase-like protein [Trametes sanguinea]
MEELRSLSNQAIVDMCKECPNLTEPDDTDFAPPPPVYVLASNVVVKVSDWGYLHEYEAKTMTLVRQRTTIPVPRVYRFFVHDSICYLVMEYVHGDTLDKCWDSLSNWQKLRIAFTLRNYVQQLRRIRTPQTEQQVPGPVTDDPSLPFPCFTPALGEYVVRPFTSYADLRDWMNGRYRAGEVVRRTPAHCLPFDDSEPLVFTHGDLCPRNLIMGTDGRIWLIDFGCSGIYPRWFEAVASLEVPKLWTATRKIMVGDYSAREEFDIIHQAAFSNGIFLPDPKEDEEEEIQRQSLRIPSPS